MRASCPLSTGWETVRLEDLLPIQYGKGLTKAERKDAGRVAVYGSSGCVGRHDVAVTTGPTIILGRKGSVGTVHYSPQPCWPIDTVYYAEGTPSSYLPFLSHLLVSLNLASLDRSTTIPGLSRDDYNVVEATVAPLAEQHRIVEAIESYLTRLDDAVATLERVQQNLKRYRASVLKAAVEGRLVPTEAELAKQEGRDYEPASMLLERILVERRERWIEDAAEKGRAKAEEKAKKAGKSWTKKDKAKVLEIERAKAVKKYKEPAAPDATDLPELTDGWCWATMDALTVFGPQNGVYIPKSQYGVGVPILRIDDYQVDISRSADELQQVRICQTEAEKYGLCNGDIVINRVNSPSHLGKSLAVVERHVPAVFESNMMRLRLAPALLPAYVQYYLISATGKTRLTHNAKWAVNQASINQGDVAATTIPVPPVNEQDRIVAEIDRLLSAGQAVGGSSEGTVLRCQRLRQSILKWAFEGKLVDQDSNDEPASVLLERIKAEREATIPTKKTNRRGGRRKKVK